MSKAYSPSFSLMRHFRIVLCVAVLLGIAGCNRNDPTHDPKPAPPTPKTMYEDGRPGVTGAVFRYPTEVVIPRNTDERSHKRRLLPQT